MTRKSLTTTEIKIIESEDEDRVFMVAGSEYDGCDSIYIRRGDVGEADFALMRGGTTSGPINVPRQRAVYAWTSEGVAKITYRGLPK